MCIIIFKPAGVSLPNTTIRRRCETSNPHGFGYATPTKYYKTMNRSAFESQLCNIKKYEPAILHFRIATHGSLKRANCHPFRDSESGVSFAHNGILNIKPIGDKTDSETAFLTRFEPVIREYGIDSEALDKAVEEIIGSSRFAFLAPDGRFRLYGRWCSIGDGCYYSHYPW